MGPYHQPEAASAVSSAWHPEGCSLNGLLFPLAFGTILIALAVLRLPPLGMALRSWRFTCRPRLPLPDYTPSVALVAPCWGIVQGFEASAHTTLAQDYPDYRVLVVTGTTDDPAYPVLARMVSEYPQARLLVAGPARERGQTVHNLPAAVEAAAALVDAGCCEGMRACDER